jgi:hypothetical protein
MLLLLTSVREVGSRSTIWRYLEVAEHNVWAKSADEKITQNSTSGGKFSITRIYKASDDERVQSVANRMSATGNGDGPTRLAEYEDGSASSK